LRREMSANVKNSWPWQIVFYPCTTLQALFVQGVRPTPLPLRPWIQYSFFFLTNISWTFRIIKW
jgi:hypothetical protein